MRRLIFIALFVFQTGLIWAAVDSLGIKEIEGKKYILHQLEARETLFSLSRRYHVSLDEILRVNADEEEGKKIDQIGRVLRIPYHEEYYKTAEAKSSKIKTHKVQPSETLYSISRTYNLSVSDLRKWNNLKGNDISIGQELRLESPRKAETTKEKTNELTAAKRDNKESEQQKTIAEDNKNVIFHTVAAGQTIYSISRIYEVSQASVKEWNNLNTNDLTIGQQLKIYTSEPLMAQEDSLSEEEAAEIIAEEKQRADEPVIAGETETSDSKAKPTYKPIDIPQKDSKKVFTDNPRANGAEIKKVAQKGIAEVIDGSAGSDKQLALHRTAKIGTIMLIKNELNGKEVFVRVLGKLPDTGVDDKVVVRISKKAFDNLGGIDAKFPVEISYMPLD